jgi:hypothetical protein
MLAGPEQAGHRQDHGRAGDVLGPQREAVHGRAVERGHVDVRDHVLREDPPQGLAEGDFLGRQARRARQHDLEGRFDGDHRRH